MDVMYDGNNVCIQNEDGLRGWEVDGSSSVRRSVSH